MSPFWIYASKVFATVLLFVFFASACLLAHGGWRMRRSRQRAGSLDLTPRMHRRAWTLFGSLGALLVFIMLVNHVIAPRQTPVSAYEKWHIGIAVVTLALLLYVAFGARDRRQMRHGKFAWVAVLGVLFTCLTGLRLVWSYWLT